MGKVSKKELKRREAVLVMSETLKAVHEAEICFMFIGAFANIGHKHFRGNPMFEIAVLSSDIEKLNSVLSNQGYSKFNAELAIEYFIGDVMIRVWEESDSSLFDDVIEECVVLDKQVFYLRFPRLGVHIAYLKEFGQFFSLEDIRLIRNKDSFDLDNFDIAMMLELYFLFAFYNSKHDHSLGSSSCKECRHWVREYRGII